MQKTMRAISQRMASMMPRTPTIVSTPVKSWVKPNKSPSETFSASETMTLATSPYGRLSMYFRGSFSTFLKASLRRAERTRYRLSGSQEMLPSAWMQSTAFPAKKGERS